MELLTRNNFESWMQKLMERIDRQDELLLSLQPSGKAPNPIERIRMFDNQDLCMLLQISKRTLQRYRSIGALPYKTLGKKTYYSEEDVLTFLSGHVKDFKKEDIGGHLLQCSILNGKVVMVMDKNTTYTHFLQIFSSISLFI